MRPDFSVNSPNFSAPISNIKSTKSFWYCCIRYSYKIIPMKRIITTNVNGIRAAEKKGFFDWIKTQDAHKRSKQAN
jgi:hypothetical protein